MNLSYSCTVSVAVITGNTDEEVMAFGASEEDAIAQAEQLLLTTYGSTSEQAAELLEAARVEPLAQWCAPS